MTTPTIGEEIDALWELREEKKALLAKAADVQKAYDEKERLLNDRLKAENVTQAAGSRARVTASESVVPAVKDWDQFYKFIHRHKYYHLLERRPSVTGCRELFESKGQIPGVEPFTKHGLRLVTQGE